MKQFPLIPFGQMLIVRILAPKGKIAMPQNTNSSLHEVAEVVAVGTGTPTIAGAMIPSHCNVGDLVIVQTETLMRISHSIRPYLIERGVPESDLDVMASVQEDHVIGKLAVMETSKPEFSAN